MKVKVVSVFRDKYTKEIYSAGQVIEVSKERYKEVQQYVEIVKTKKGQE
jgi:ABC-type phosphate/phosphonate transport system substrate-binding protein